MSKLSFSKYSNTSNELSDNWSQAYPQISQPVLAIVHPALAHSTVSLRARISRLLPKNPTADDVVLAVDALEVSKATKMQYTKAAQAIFPQIADSLAVRLYKRALAKQGATIPQHQATPISKYQLTQLLFNLDRRSALAAILAYKTASRWSEVCRLTKLELSLKFLFILHIWWRI